MKRSSILILLAFGFNAINAQVGIGTTGPNASLDVVGKATTANVADGMIAPRISRLNLAAKTAYGANQNAAIVYVDSLDGTASGQTTNVTSIRYYYYDNSQGTAPVGRWVKLLTSQNSDWRITGNPDAEISSGTAALGTAPTANSNFLGTIGADNLVVTTNNLVHAILYTNGTINGGGETNSSILWGRGNTNEATPTYNNIALGLNNTVGGANLPVGPNAGNYSGIAIGSGNTATGGGIAIGFKNTASLQTGYAIGLNNTVTTGFAYGNNNNVATGGYAIGGGNSVNSVALIFGLNVPASVSANGYSVYGNNIHRFLSDGGGTTTYVTINNIDSIVSTLADLHVSKGVQVKQTGTSGTTATPTGTCDARNAGTIVYFGTGFYGCRSTASGFGWLAF